MLGSYAWNDNKKLTLGLQYMAWDPKTQQRFRVCLCVVFRAAGSHLFLLW